MTREHADQLPRPQLVHPVYLDVPMMISFLAALQDGVSFEDTTTRRASSATAKERAATSGARVPVLASLIGFDISGRMGRTERGEESEEVKAVRQHTSASLFNALYEVMLTDGVLKNIDNADDFKELAPGDLVELSGDFVGNPQEAILAFFKQAVPYFEMASEGESQPTVDLEAVQAEVTAATAEAADLADRAAKAARSGNPATKANAVALRQRSDGAKKRAQDLTESAQVVVAQLIERHQQQLGTRMLSQVAEDLATAPVQDTVINSKDFNAVLTMSAEFFTDATKAYLRAGVFRAVGKATRILSQGDEINLLRRTVLGAAGRDFGRDMLSKTVEEEQLQLETFDPIVEPPAVQVLPLAVFI